MAEPDVLIVGAGLAGLCCARRLQAAGVSFLIVEGADRAGGRVRTDEVEGHLLDRGFQVLLDSYPEAKAQLDYQALGLRKFNAGALIRMDQEFFPISDPWRDPLGLLSMVTSPVGTLGDKMKLARLRAAVTEGQPWELFDKPETTTALALEQLGFSPAMIQHFFRPFFGGILLDSTLGASSRMFEFAFRMMSEGRAALPAKGMQAIPNQLAAALPPGSIRLNARVSAIRGTAAVLESGEEITASAVVIATDVHSACPWLSKAQPALTRKVTCLYFSAPEPPIEEPTLVLNGEGRGIINNLCVPSQVAPAYAPRNRALVSVTVLDGITMPQETLVAQVRSDLREWFGKVAGSWQTLGLYRIADALPVTRPLAWIQPELKVRDGVYVCGDHTATPSIQGAMHSGRAAAEAVLAAQTGQ